ncbi:2-C-methyl-D-erythritol 2,4-cyclodiphosphate synthase [Gemmiger formicilis]|uniref:2-C-methyl-D-erythritol 2,4-cyclodiphosphate synthase n=1 Tax=Gemmiger formicilis TaxID=745368 RepID=UPI00195B968F|nr:2-C-methyl-D-erythritol 2,4-cyclodiphosphate synthase [Gemmiger formicilis]MBM6715159.1 2-C-methyl-D-erythritol 2,4-cyclodiphosphate synthase [Gemmiger formicilis]
MAQTVTAILVAAGASRRMGFDKLSHRLPGGLTVLQTSLRAFENHPRITQIVLVAGANLETCRQLAAACTKPCTAVPGGATRAQSVCAGLAAATGEMVAIHDAARPFVSEEVITAAIDAAEQTGAAAPAVAVKDTVKVAAADGRVLNTPDRSTLFAVQTPQCFRRELYLRALDAVSEDKADLVTDDCSLFELAGLPVVLTPGDYANLKITTKEDLKGESTMRIGHGYDVHRLVEGRRLILGGVDIPYEKGLLGHSDADVLLHAVSDALLGAAALGDIGKHFPDTDPRYEGADSLRLLQEVGNLVRQAGYTVGNVDATVLCQAPKLAPHIQTMRANIARALDVPVECISVKATTEEHLGFTGQGQGIAAHAVALLES